jgi:hypothetical protein
MMYANLRRNIRRILDRALRRSKLAGAVRRHALRVDPQSIVKSDAVLMADLEERWKRSDRAL